MKFINAAGFFPLYVGDVEREIPGWTDGDPLPDGWHQIVETVRPPDENTYQETLNPDPVEGFIPEGCEGIRENVTTTQHISTVVHNSGSSQWEEVWEPTTTTHEEPYSVVAVKKDGEWLTPAQYIAAFNEAS
tara:strand:- start:20 stop:415 length:396 start_codon:yes stop_codon:yes gene_type:complete